ncbi:hypothetical protein [Pukyongiella litopenaei]|uniref:Uncharacterized protein n=1 Tax=Pukyongiella litopenaei TaxID=2605946 RepID=A0A2S0MK64_9RHOB|nr:hypothetical protein [Pukyongiella litopenaei]AVO36256.1 hypothetical protein C6Y53_00010 [Pukyongiella litopenaei]
MIPRLIPSVAALILLSQPALAVSKTEDCTYQAAIVAAVQQARLDGVKQADVVGTITAGNRDWPGNYDNAIPIFAAQIYGLKKRQLKKTDLGAEWMNTCMSN